MSEVKYAIAILKEKLSNADRHNLAYQRLSIADMEAVWGVLEKADKDYAELKAQRDALAAENVALKDINAWCHTEAFQNMHREFKTAEAIGCPDVDCMHDAMLVAIMHAPEAPATSAYLNSVRADAVIEASAYLADMADGKSPSTSELIKACARTVFAYGEKLRAGKDGE